MLAELLVSLGIMTLVLAAALSLWQTGIRLWQRESGVMTLQQEGRTVLEMVAREVRRARKDSVEIVLDGGSGRPALQFIVEEAGTQAKISFLQEGTNLMRRKDKGDGAGTNVYLANINMPNGFLVVFIDLLTGSRRNAIGSRLADHETIELVVRCQRAGGDYMLQTQVVPRN